MRGIVFGALMALTITTANATEDINADDWAANCLGDAFGRGLCAGAAANFIDGMLNYQQGMPFGMASHRLICWRPEPPKNGSADTYYPYAMVGVRFLQANPSYAKLPTPALLLAAYMRAWPCGEFEPLKK